MPGFAQASPPSEDKRWKIVQGTMRRHGHTPGALIEVLHTVQETFGFLTEEALKFVAESLRLPYSKVMGVATFYNYFSMKPAGEHTCVVCTGTACYINGAPQLLRAVEEVTGVKPGETTRDGKVSVVSARCLGACGLAPVVVFDSEVAGKVTVEKISTKLKGYMVQQAAVEPDREAVGAGA
jgi:bidirectional [NiFe] hydrogenase diaphorase subunit